MGYDREFRALHAVMFFFSRKNQVRRPPEGSPQMSCHGKSAACLIPTHLPIPESKGQLSALASLINA